MKPISIGTAIRIIFTFDNLSFAFRRLPAFLTPCKTQILRNSEKHGKFGAINFAFIDFSTGGCPFALILQKAKNRIQLCYWADEGFQSTIRFLRSAEIAAVPSFQSGLCQFFKIRHDGSWNNGIPRTVLNQLIVVPIVNLVSGRMFERFFEARLVRFPLEHEGVFPSVVTVKVLAESYAIAYNSISVQPRISL